MEKISLRVYMCKRSIKQGMGQTGKAALHKGHTLKEDLSPRDRKTIKQRETKATCNSKIMGKLVMYL